MAGVITLRPAGVSDAATVAGIHGRARSAYYSGEASGAADPRRVDLWSRWLADAERTTVCAEVSGAAVGFLSVATFTDPELAPEPLLELVALYVDPTSWDVGVGGRLYGWFLERLADSGGSGGVLQVWDGNERAYRFYLRRGWYADGWSRPGASGSRYLRLRLK